MCAELARRPRGLSCRACEAGSVFRACEAATRFLPAQAVLAWPTYRLRREMSRCARHDNKWGDAVRTHRHGQSAQPDGKVRFHLFHGPDQAQSRALGTRLVQALGADRFIVISNFVRSDPAALADEASALALFGGNQPHAVDEPRPQPCGALLAALLLHPP